MKNSIKTLATWLIIAVIFVVLFSTIWNGANTKMSYSDLLINIKSGNVESIEISASKTSAKVLYKDSNTNNKLTKTVNIPSLDSFMEQTLCFNELDYVIAGSPFMPIGVICEDEITEEEIRVSESLGIPILFRNSVTPVKKQGVIQPKSKTKRYCYTREKNLF